MNFLRWFSALSFLTVAVSALGTAVTLSHFLAEEILQWDAVVTSQFVVTVAETQSAYGGFPRRTGVAEVIGGTFTAAELGVKESAALASIAEFRDHLRALPGAVAIRIYALDRSLAWSFTKDGFESRSGGDEEEYRMRESAFRLPYAVRYAALGRWDHPAGYGWWGEPPPCCVENYVPLYDLQNRVVGVVEIHKDSERLQAIMERGQVLVWISLLISGGLVYLTLFWLARRANNVIADQQRRLVDSETFTVIGEMSLAVAHGIRSPLAAIRSSAELTLDEVRGETRKHMMDIMAQADRLNSWLRDLLHYSRPSEPDAEPVSVVEVLRECVDSFSARLAPAGIDLDWVEPRIAIPPAKGNRPLLLQAFSSLIGNAVEVMRNGGRLTVRCEMERNRGLVCVSIADTGHGMTPEQLAQAFRPFKTSKPHGLGVGLWLVKRTIERTGGRVHIESRVGQGTTVEIHIPVAK